jgi:hypothetical protein
MLSLSLTKGCSLLAYTKNNGKIKIILQRNIIWVHAAEYNISWPNVLFRGGKKHYGVGLCPQICQFRF